MNQFKTKAPGFINVLILVLLIAVLGVMEKRDAEAQEFEQLRQMIELESECGPTIELSLPIEPENIQM